MNKGIRLVLAAATLIMSSVLVLASLAADLTQIKAAGLVGERLDGYLDVVQPDVPDDVKAMVNNINSQRRAEYERIARKNSVSVAEVAHLAAQKIIQQAAPGHYVQTPSGWQRR